MKRAGTSTTCHNIKRTTTSCFKLVSRGPLIPVSSTGTSRPINLKHINHLPGPITLGSFTRQMFSRISSRNVADTLNVRMYNSSSAFIRCITVLPNSKSSLFGRMHTANTSICMADSLHRRPIASTVRRTQCRTHVESRNVVLNRKVTKRDRIHPYFVGAPRTTVRSV